MNVALSDNEVKMLAAGVSPLRVRPGNLLRYWNTFGLASPETDYSSSGQNLTINNSPSLAGHAPVAPMFAFESAIVVGGAAAPAGDPEGKLTEGKLIRGGLLRGGVLVG